MKLIIVDCNSKGVNSLSHCKFVEYNSNASKCIRCCKKVSPKSSKEVHLDFKCISNHSFYIWIQFLHD